MSAADEGIYAQGDLARAIQRFVHDKLPLTPQGAAECERLIREYGEGNRVLWKDPHYLRTTTMMAMELVRTVRGGAS